MDANPIISFTSAVVRVSITSRKFYGANFPDAQAAVTAHLGHLWRDSAYVATQQDNGKWPCNRANTVYN